MKRNLIFALTFALVMSAFFPAQVAAQADNWNNWRALPQGTFGGNATIQRVAWAGAPGPHGFIAVETNGVIARSANGSAWTAITVPESGLDTFGNWALAWGNPGGQGRFFMTQTWAEGYVGNQWWQFVVMYTSPTGTQWARYGAFNTSDGGSLANIRPSIGNIVWGGPAGRQRFVGVGNEFVMHSADGIAASAFTFPGINFRGLAWGGQGGQQRFITAGHYGDSVWIFSSADGESWNWLDGGPVAALGNGVNAIAWGGPAGRQRFVAVGNGGIIAHSPDGAAWTAVANSPFGSSNVNAIAWGGPAGRERFVAAGNDGRIAHSTDGAVWTLVPDSTFGAAHINDIAAGQGRFVAVGGGGRMALLTFD